ncbi:MAG: PAS domain S-box protein [Oryzomonas sp.]|uniref:hybrid sensor histidine kinase/response regulator n=1 Tax=Oryzomonas sp. TaxID=2855186 RepID=UPI00283CDFCE|nr:PAS domain S-box protein [Oryzomonas sp.]MDR3581415.1 PAS domain S-box protein [Oryzomonas sp.]
MLRYLSLVVALTWKENYLTNTAYHLFIIASAVLLLHGTMQFIGKSPIKWPIITGGALALWTIGSLFQGLSLMFVTIPVFAFLALTYLYTGMQLLKHAQPGETARHIVGWLFIAWGVHQTDYPLLRPIKWFAPWGFLIGSILALSIAIGMILIYFEKMQKKLQEKEELHRNLIESSHDWIWEINANGIYTYTSPLVQELLGYTPEDILGKTSFELMPEAEASRLRETFKDISSKRAPFHGLEKIIRHKDGRLIVLETSGVPFYDGKGVYLGYRGMDQDISERKLAEETLQISEERLLESNQILSGVLEHTYVNTVFLDPQFNYRWVNRAYADTCRHEPYFFPGKYLFDLYPHEENQAIFQDVVNTGKSFFTTAKPFEFPDQTERGVTYWDWSLIPLKNDSGNVTGLVYTLAEVTERIRAEEEKDKLETQLQLAQKMESVGRLAGGIAHDFNNLLTVILGHAQLGLMKTDPSLPLFDNLEEIYKAGERSADLTRQLLAFARKQTVAPTVLDLNKILTGMLNMLQRLIGEDIELTWLPATDLWPVNMDPSQIDQILVNLCVNGRDAISGVGKITIETGNIVCNDSYCNHHTGFVPGEYVLLVVSDDGCGMDKETLGHIFEPFFTTKGVGKGTGLGLATVYGIVKQNNGLIYVYSEKDHGTTFNIYLPRHDVASRPAHAAESAEVFVVGGQETILLVEDERAILEMTTTMLKMQGYTVLPANTPEEAIHTAEEHSGEIHLLATDVIMPRMNGQDLAKKLLPLHPHIKHLFMSGYTANVIAHNGMLEVGVNFIQKPFSMQDLATKVREVLNCGQRR